MEKCPSGLRCNLGKVVYGRLYPGFESLLLRFLLRIFGRVSNAVAKLVSANCPIERLFAEANKSENKDFASPNNPRAIIFKMDENPDKTIPASPFFCFFI